MRGVYGLCWAKNFYRMKDGELVYIDIFGIYSSSVGQAFAKQMAMLPVESRKHFFDGYLKALQQKKSFVNFDLQSEVVFYYFNFLVSKIYQGVTRKNNRRYERGCLVFQDFYQRAVKGDDLYQWIIHKADRLY